MTSCADGILCYGPERRCDGVALCDDGSDELGCPCHYNGTTIEVQSQTAFYDKLHLGQTGLNLDETLMNCFLQTMFAQWSQF